MAMAGGEERLLTLFADAHYYFVEPTPRPLHHRFDKASYIYLYWNAADRLGRLEIANHAGTPNQDAFTGYLDSSKIRQSYKQPTLCTLTVDGYQRPSGPHPKATSDQNHWRLPSTDPRDEGRYLFCLHTIDLYFWTVQDAETFMSSVQRTLEQEQVEISDRPQAVQAQKQYEAPMQTPNSTTSTAASHKDLRSPVVQQLENIATSDPGYQNGQTRDSRGSTLPKASSPYGDNRSPDPRNARSSLLSTPSISQQVNPPAEAHTPLAYNPAAPPAPEPIRHREKTPPPVEGAAGTGLAAAALNDHVHETAAPQSNSSFLPPPPANQYPQQPNQPYMPGPPRSHHGSVSGSAYGSPVPPQTYPPSTTSSQNLSNTTSLTPQPTHSSQSSYTPGPPIAHQTSHASQSPYAPQPQRHDSYDPTLPSPATEILGPSFSPPHPSQPLQHLQPQYADYLASHTPPAQSNSAYQPTAPPAGGYSNYDYAAQGSQHRHHGHHGSGYDPHAIHSQVYRPTEDEAAAEKPARRKTSNTPGRLDQGVDKVEKKVGGFLKRLEKRIG